MIVPSITSRSENLEDKVSWHDIETFESHMQVAEHDHENPGMTEHIQSEESLKLIDDQSFDITAGVRTESTVELKRKQRIALMLLCRGAVGRRYPFLTRPQLFTLPPSYTQLHSQLTTLSNYSFPALCLICGAVMDANGKGMRMDNICIYNHKHIRHLKVFPFGFAFL
jgi:hypothetical protein